MTKKSDVCLVTGAGAGIGKAIAQALAAQGSTVILAARRLELLEQAASEIRQAGGRAEALQLDITDRSGVKDAIAGIVQQHGGIDVLVNNAGMMPMPGNLVDADDQIWDELLLVNTTGTYNVTKAVLPTMIAQQYGRIINLSSISAKLTWAGFVAYGTAKGALHAFTTALAREVAPNGITVNCVLPGFTRTEEMERIWGTIASAQGMTVDALVQPILDAKVPIKRWIAPEEVGRLIAFLAHRDAGALTGQFFVIDGGLDAHD